MILSPSGAEEETIVSHLERDNLKTATIDFPRVTAKEICAIIATYESENICFLLKVESGKLDLEEAEFDIGHELEGLVDMFSVQCINNNIEIALDLNDNLPGMVRGDSARLVQIFANLISNSIKFTSSGYIILRGWSESSVTSEGTDRTLENGKESQFSTTNSRYGHSFQNTEKLTVWFEVEDTGCGIDPSKWESVFESFVQADLSTTRTYGGTGLGLCIVRSLVQKMGGHISIKPKEGPGTLIRLSIEFGLSPRTLQCPSPHIWNKFAVENPVVFLALSDKISRQIMSEWLQQNSIQSFEASSWHEIMDMLSKQVNLHTGIGSQSPHPSLSNIMIDNNEKSKHLSDYKGITNLNPASSQKLEKRHYFVVMDAKFAEIDTNLWKDQVFCLNKFNGRVKFAWLLNPDTSTLLKYELRKIGHYIMVNRPLYKSKLIQTLSDMIRNETFRARIDDKSQVAYTSSEEIEKEKAVSKVVPQSELSCMDRSDSQQTRTNKDLNNPLYKRTPPDSENITNTLVGMREERNCASYHMKESGCCLASSILVENSEYKNMQNEEVDSVKCSTSAFTLDNSSQSYSDSADNSTSSGIYSRHYLFPLVSDFKHVRQNLTRSMNERCKSHCLALQPSSQRNINDDAENLVSGTPLISPSSELNTALCTCSKKIEIKEKKLPIENGKGKMNGLNPEMTTKKYSNLSIPTPPSYAVGNEKCLQGIHILLAEDTPVLQRVATILLKKLGASVVAVGDGLQALDALKSTCKKDDTNDKIENYEDGETRLDSLPFDLVLMDCQMPRMDGYEATKAIREAEKRTNTHIPIVALTAHAMSSDEAKCLEVGMDAYLTKPINYELMASTILSLTKRLK